MSGHYDVIVIGGGASGMMASIFSARNGNNTLLIEHNEKLGKKLFITGKGRCNLTNNSSIENHLNNIITNPKFMHSALNAFSPQDVMMFFEEGNLKLKTERGNRVFPLSDKSSDVIKALENYIKNYDINIILNTKIDSIYKTNIFNVMCNKNIIYTADNLIVATGGISYSGTGATDFGYNIAKKFGHNIISLKPSLAPIIVYDDISSLNGITLKNVALNIYRDDKLITGEQGEMLFTYNSLTGPIALTLSSRINKIDLTNIVASIDLKPALSYQTLDDKLIREFALEPKKKLKTYIFSLLPNKLVEYFIQKAKLPDKNLSEVSKADRQNIISNLKRFDLNVKSIDNINVSVVTSGGVDVREINSKTCESKLINGLYFVGEVLDVDALTGGYNLQIAWSTGYVAGSSITKK